MLHVSWHMLEGRLTLHHGQHTKARSDPGEMAKQRRRYEHMQRYAIVAEMCLERAGITLSTGFTDPTPSVGGAEFAFAALCITIGGVRCW